MAFRLGQQNFSKGVLSKALWGRSDIAPYSAGVRQGTNVIILKYGGLQKRPGSLYVYEIIDGLPKKLIPFEGAFEASYALLMGQATQRQAAGGGMVVETALTVKELTLTNPIQIKASFHGYTSGDEVFFTGLTGPDELNGRILIVTVIDANHFTVPVDGTGFDPLTADSGGIVRGSAPAAPPSPPTVPVESTPPPPPPIGGGGRGDFGGTGGTGGGVMGGEIP
jgi:hypothetical protein